MDKRKYLSMPDHDLLITVVVGQEEIRKDVAEIKGYQKTQNGILLEMSKTTSSNSTWINVLRWSFGVIIMGGITGVITKIRGLW